MLNRNIFAFTSKRLFSSQFATSSYNCPPPLDQDLINLVLSVNDDINENKLSLISEVDDEEQQYDLKGRNSKQPKKANHGARPCSSVMRKLKKQGWYKKITAI